MTLYENIELMEPFFHAIRKHQSFFIIDVTLPTQWTYKDEVVSVKGDIGVKDNGVKGDKRYLSFYSKSESIHVQLAVNTILKVITNNEEREEKDRLLQEKIIELKRRFETTELDKLKDLHFEVNNEETNNEEIELNEGQELVGETSSQG